MFCISVRNKQQVYYSCAIVLLLRHIYWKYDLFIAKYIDINAIIYLYFSYNISISSDREFNATPIKRFRFLFQFSRDSFWVVVDWIQCSSYTPFKALIVNVFQVNNSLFIS